MTKEEIYNAIAKLDRKMEAATKSLATMAEQMILLKAVAETVKADPTEKQMNAASARALGWCKPKRGEGLAEKLQMLRDAMNEALMARGKKLKRLTGERRSGLELEANFESGSFEPYAAQFIGRGYDVRDLLDLRQRVIESGDFWEYRQNTTIMPKGEKLS